MKKTCLRKRIGPKPATNLGIAFGLVLLLPAVAIADPVVGPGGKPSAAVSWSSSGGAVVLKISSDFDAATVAKAISSGVPGATAKADDEQVVVSGVKEADLLKALEKVEVEQASDDVDEMLSALQNPGGDEEGSGSSIRATQAADLSGVLGKKTELIRAKVIAVKRHRFPLVMVTVRLEKVPKSVKGLRRGATITVIPRVKSRNGIIDPNDKASKLNVGAWYAQRGDKVMLRLEKPADKKVWIAAAFDRRAR